MTTSDQTFPDDLTQEQIAALDNYLNTPRAFYGMTRKSGIRIFRAINEMKKTNPEKAREREQRWFQRLNQ